MCLNLQKLNVRNWLGAEQNGIKETKALSAPKSLRKYLLTLWISRFIAENIKILVNII